MRIALRTSAAVTLICCVLSCAAQIAGAGSPTPKSPHADAQSVTTRHAMVVSIHHEATDAGVAILRKGGNAVDAAVAVGFALAVVYPEAGNLGGGGFMLLRTHSGDAHFLDFRERAPAAATRDMYLDAKGRVIPNASTLGYRAIGVPGTVAGLVYAQHHFGHLSLAQDMAPAIRLAREGFVLSGEEARALASAKNLAQFPESHRIFQRDGNPYRAGDRFAQPELARTLTRIAADPTTFYYGSVARELAAAVQRGGGLITAADLAAYRVRDRRPLAGNYRGYNVLTAPPPSSGGIVLLETLDILSGYDLTHINGAAAPHTPDRSPEQVHLITEAFRRAFMDRTAYLGDPDFTTLPIAQLASPDYAAAWRAGIDPTKPTPSAGLKRPAGFLPQPPTAPAREIHESPQTTHFSIVDAEGNAVSTTYTLNNTFGSGVTAAGLGFLLNDEMDDFTSAPGVPNMYGLIQSPANSIAPGKRPLSAMTPTIVLRGNRPVLVLGSPGGPTIITTVANDLVSIVDNHLTAQQAADAPRFHHQYLPDILDVEKSFPAATADALRSSGYTVHRSGEGDPASSRANSRIWGDSELISIDPRTGTLSAGHDHRHSFGSAAGY
jgi:gamma-glutamyltranspeptidase / glutathione hydrolase